MTLNMPRLINDRIRRLYAVACCREIWDQVTAQACRDSVLVAEKFADGDATEEERGTAYGASFWASDLAPHWAPDRVANCATFSPTPNAAYWAAHWAREAGMPLDRQAVLLDDLAPRTITVPFTPDIARLAESAYHDRLEDGSLDPLTLSALADAIEDVSGPDEVVAHLRTKRKHYRGMWSLDLCRVPVEVMA